MIWSRFSGEGWIEVDGEVEVELNYLKEWAERTEKEFKKAAYIIGEYVNILLWSAEEKGKLEGELVAERRNKEETDQYLTSYMKLVDKLQTELAEIKEQLTHVEQYCDIAEGILKGVNQWQKEEKEKGE
jgi:hypothetical protein